MESWLHPQLGAGHDRFDKTPHKDAISDADMKKLYESETPRIDNTVGQRKVYI